MADYGLFNTRVNAYGDTDRERIINTTKEDISKNLYDHPSLRDVRLGTNLNKIDRKIVVISTNDPNIKQISSLPGETFNVGEYVEFKNQIWLVNQADVDDELYVDGQMTICSNILKFQDTTGKIHSYPYFVDNSTSSLDENKLISTSSTTRKIKLPFDEYTREFYIGKRFMGEIFGGIPQVWKINDLDAESNRGLLVVTLKKDEFNKDKDSIKYGICNFFEVATPPAQNNIVQIMYNGKSELRVGGSFKDFSAKYYDNNGEEILDVNSTWTVQIHPLFEDYITSETDGDKISLKVEDVSGIVGEVISLTVVGDNEATAQIDITVVPLF